MSIGEFRDKFAIVGAAVTPTARTHAKGYTGLMLEGWAARLAIEDAGLRREDIDGAVHTIFGSPHPPAQWDDAYTRVIGLKPNWYMTVARGGQMAHNGILLATQALSMGLCKYAIVSAGLPGWSFAHNGSGQAGVGLPFRGGMQHNGLETTGFRASIGATGTHGFLASRHMHEYGTTAEHLGSVAVTARQWACLNPEARFFDRPLTMEEYLAAPFLTWPYRKYDYCVHTDMGAAIVLTTADRARSTRKSPVYVKGLGLGDQARSQIWEHSQYTQTDGAFAVRTALHEAGVGIRDIDVAELYDCFTMEPILYMEDYGWCQKGEGGDFIASGATAPGGSIPMNTYGGLLSGMYLMDFGGVVEAVRQLRGECAERQVAGAELALTNGHGGEMIRPGMCSSHAVMVLGGSQS
ncbi:MAG: hypothetical protein Q8M47_09555 [Devosia sp.]|nr:hypothetical protein [Devosia sp.]